MDQLLEDFEIKHTTIATERSKNILSPKSVFKHKKLSVNFPTNITSTMNIPDKPKYQGLIKPKVLNTYKKPAMVTLASPKLGKAINLTDRIHEPVSSSHRRKKGERSIGEKPVMKSQVLMSAQNASAKKSAMQEGPKEVSFIEEGDSGSAIDQSENIENYTSSPAVLKRKMEEAAPVPQNTKILTTNFQKKESNTKYMAISF